MLKFFSKNKKNTEIKTSDDGQIEPMQQIEELSWFAKLKLKLKQNNFLFNKIFNLFTVSEINYNQLEELLLNTDIDYELTEQLINQIKACDKNERLTAQSAKELMKKFMLDVLQPHYKKFDLEQYKNDTQIVLLICGINGGGKTTSIAKIASLYRDEYKPLLVACDSFRAAAREQLLGWATNLELEIFQGENENDPAAIAYKSIDYARQNENNLLLLDTSGRLHNNANLMAELEKINRVVKKQNENFPQEVILVLDGTMGQSLKDQVENFNKSVKLTGLIVTKLDGIARGGIILSLVNKFKLPIYFIGIGEKASDINYFNPEDFVDSLLM